MTNTEWPALFILPLARRPGHRAQVDVDIILTLNHRVDRRLVIWVVKSERAGEYDTVLALYTL